MRISDWSSDVCSSDLMRPDGQTLDPEQVNEIARELNVRPQDVSEMEVRLSGREMALDGADNDDDDSYDPIAYLSDDGQEPSEVLERQDRKSGVEGKSVAVRVNLGGRRIIKKKK